MAGPDTRVKPWGGGPTRAQTWHDSNIIQLLHVITLYCMIDKTNVQQRSAACSDVRRTCRALLLYSNLLFTLTGLNMSMMCRLVLINGFL